MTEQEYWERVELYLGERFFWAEADEVIWDGYREMAAEREAAMWAAFDASLRAVYTENISRLIPLPRSLG